MVILYLARQKYILIATLQLKVLTWTEMEGSIGTRNDYSGLKVPHRLPLVLLVP